MAKLSNKQIAIVVVAVFVAAALLSVIIYLAVKGTGNQTPNLSGAFLHHTGTTLFPTGRSDTVPPGVVRIHMSDSPIMDTLDRFLTPQEAAGLVAMAEHRFVRSGVVDPGTGTQRPDTTRTSSTVFLQKSENDLVKAVEERAAQVAGLPSSYLERLQVTRYTHGQFYKPHFDYLPVTEDVDKNGQRSVTIFAYLADVPAGETGAATVFPNLNVRMRPKLGSALLWHNMDGTGKVDPRTLHGGEEIHDPATVKYGLNIWFRTKPQLHLLSPATGQ